VLNPFIALHMLALDITDRLKREEKGASAVEYALLVGLIAAAVVAAVTLFGDQLSELFSDVIPDAPAAS
jgi:pilus assembly protein Flp/PilA